VATQSEAFFRRKKSSFPGPEVGIREDVPYTCMTSLAPPAAWWVDRREEDRKSRGKQGWYFFKDET